MKNNKGFTLVELLVVIVIMGIITGISLPMIRNIQEGNENKKVTVFKEALLQSAKVYMDSYENDLFGEHENGCAYITYEDLVKKDLLKDIEIDDISCNSKSTFVKVMKINNQYSYAYYLGCGEKVGSKADKITISYPEENKVYEMDSLVCGGTNGSNIVISADQEDTSIQRRKKTRLHLTSATGLNNRTSIYTAWSMEEDTEGLEESDWTKIEFSVPSVENQEQTLLSAENVTTVSPEIITPPNEDGDYMLYVRVEDLQDMYGEKWINLEDEESNIISFGPFKVDNTPPKCTIKGESTEWINGNRRITFGCDDSLETDSGCATKDTIIIYTKTAKTGMYPSRKIKDKAGNVRVCRVRPINIYIDKEPPTWKPKNDPLKIDNKPYSFSENVDVTWGISGEGTITCDPSESRQTGNYKVECFATSVTGVDSEKKEFEVSHQVDATQYNNKSKDPCGEEDNWTQCESSCRGCTGNSNGCSNTTGMDDYTAWGTPGSHCYTPCLGNPPKVAKKCKYWACPEGTTFSDKKSTKSQKEKVCYYN